MKYAPMPPSREEDNEFKRRIDEVPEVCPTCGGTGYTEMGLECPDCCGDGGTWL